MKEALWDTNLMLLPMLGVLALLILFPEIALFLPRLISPEFLRKSGDGAGVSSSPTAWLDYRRP